MNLLRIRRRSFLAAIGSLPLAANAEANTPSLMLANAYRSAIPLADYWVSEKLDGVRGYWDGHSLWTRAGHRIDTPAGFTADWPSHTLDGELWAGRGGFTAASSAVALGASNAQAWRRLRYAAFDLPSHHGDFDARLDVLRTLNTTERLQILPQRKFADEAALHAQLAATVRAGGEGLVLHRGASLYKGERGDDLLKLKEHLDAEAKVVGHVAGKGKYAGMLGALVVQTPQGTRFRLGSGLRDADRSSPPALGSIVTYRYSGVTDKGVPRFASFWRTVN